MAEDAEPRRLITPPPGLLPPVPAREADVPVTTGSETRKVSRSEAPPVFFPAGRMPEAVAVPADAPQAWVVELEDGTRHGIGESGLAAGRNPAAPDQAPAAELLTLEDPDRSVSKTHALFRLEGDGVTVTDLFSTNGVAVTFDGATLRPVPGEPQPVADGATVALGSCPVRVSRGPA